MGHWLVAGLFGLTLVAAAKASKRLWPRFEPAHGLPLLPAWPWRQPEAKATGGANALKGLTTGWRATALGNPATIRYPQCWQSLPRTPWDLAVFDGRLYVGLGNASNDGPSANAGPVPLFSLHLGQANAAHGRWRQEATLPEEEISRFIARGDALWIPGADARSSWRWGNLYQRSVGVPLWWQERRLPGFIHAYDLSWHQGRIVVAGNVADAVSHGPEAQRHGSALAVSGDGGRSWQVQRLAGWRATALLPVAGGLFAVEALPGPGLRRWLEQGGRWVRFAAVQELDGEGRWLARADLPPERILPGVKGAGQRFGWIDGVTPSGTAAAWIVSLGPWAKEQPRRVAFVAQNLRAGAVRVLSIQLSPGTQAMDLASDAQGWLLLSGRLVKPGRWQSQILRLKPQGEGLVPHTLVSFTAPLPAWSLAGAGGRWIVGFGPAPFQPEPSRGDCTEAERFSGSVVELGPEAEGDPFSRRAPPTSR
jgi:hypothetical protein